MCGDRRRQTRLALARTQQLREHDGVGVLAISREQRRKSRPAPSLKARVLSTKLATIAGAELGEPGGSHFCLASDGGVLVGLDGARPAQTRSLDASTRRCVQSCSPLA